VLAPLVYCLMEFYLIAGVLLYGVSLFPTRK